eukprot:CAMPEP_0176084214 /NCGR_PEP_ID=MMETSP0120_2-20121206/42141_1 /TAXON_ID=160619 /ORGANISM="Kryptoperidinium foliaceum, Strain CCMP 1326" /LENGTH=219 /DNA_ID=CAMNT_0017418015 /DNA_START=423 /DNA_END=1078 /DNA_ORIENTATION=+
MIVDQAIRQAVREDDIGVSLLVRDECSLALPHFIQALGALNMMASDTLQDLACKDATKIAAPRRHASHSSKDEVDCQDLCYWRDPFVTSEVEALKKSHAAEAVTACVVFNAALVHHFKARRISGESDLDPRTTRRACQVAIQLYQQCLKVLEDIPLNPQWYVFKIAVINNMGHLYELLNLPQSSQVLFQELLSAFDGILHRRGQLCLPLSSSAEEQEEL